MIDDTMDCVDSSVSITQEQMTNLVEELKNIEIFRPKIISGNTRWVPPGCQTGPV